MNWSRINIAIAVANIAAFVLDIAVGNHVMAYINAFCAGYSMAFVVMDVVARIKRDDPVPQNPLDNGRGALYRTPNRQLPTGGSGTVQPKGEV